MIPIAPWHFDRDWQDVRVLTMIQGADDDTRYSRFLCPPTAAPGTAFQAYLHTCPD